MNFFIHVRGSRLPVQQIKKAHDFSQAFSVFLLLYIGNCLDFGHVKESKNAYNFSYYFIISMLLFLDSF